MNIGQVDHGGRINQQVRAGTDFLRTFATTEGGEQDLVTKRDSYRIQKDEIVMSVGSNIFHGGGLKWNKHQAYPLVTSTLGNMKKEYVVFILYNVHTPCYLTSEHLSILANAIHSHEKSKIPMEMLKMIPNMRPVGITVGDAEASGEVGDTVCTAQVGGTRSTLATGPWEINCNDLVSVYIQGWEEHLYDEHGKSLELLETFWRCLRTDDNPQPQRNEVIIRKKGNDGELEMVKGDDAGNPQQPRDFCPVKFALYCMHHKTPEDNDKECFDVVLGHELKPGQSLSQHTKMLKKFHDRGRLGMPSRHHPHTSNKKHLFGIKPYHEMSVWAPCFGDRNRIIGRAISSSKPYTQSDILISRSLL